MEGLMVDSPCKTGHDTPDKPTFQFADAAKSCGQNSIAAKRWQKS
jgi:hypothetical protein